MATIAEIIDPELLKKLEALKARLENDKEKRRRNEVNKNKSKSQTYQSMKHFEREFLPKSFEKRMAEKPTDARALGVSLAKESLEKFEEELHLIMEKLTLRR